MPARKALRVAAILVAVVALWLLVSRLPLLRWIVEGAQLARAAGTPGAIATTLAIYLLTLLFAPIIPLTIAAGWLYGIWGGLLALSAAVASAATSFAIARALARSAATQALLQHPRARALADLAAELGALTVLLVRLSPLLPYTPSNAVLGLTPMRLRDLVLGTAVGMAPGTVLYAWAGSLLPGPQAILQGEPLHGGPVWALFGVALGAAVVLGTAAARRLRQLSGELPPPPDRRPPG